jgi:hypothetical protein
MNLNLLSYLIFLPAMMAIAVWTARSCHRNGRVWMLGIFDGDAPSWTPSTTCSWWAATRSTSAMWPSDEPVGTDHRLGAHAGHARSPHRAHPAQPGRHPLHQHQRAARLEPHPRKHAHQRSTNTPTAMNNLTVLTYFIYLPIVLALTLLRGPHPVPQRPGVHAGHLQRPRRRSPTAPTGSSRWASTC